MINLEEFHMGFLQSIIADAETRGLMQPQSFFETVCEDLAGAGDLTVNCTSAEYIKKGIEIYGYDYDAERQILTILNHQFFQEDEIQTLTKAQIDIKLSRLKAFFIKCTEGIYSSLEETSEAYSMAYDIYRYFVKKEIKKVRCMVLTDGKATKNLTDLTSETIGTIQFEFRVVDIEYIYNIFRSGIESTPFEIITDLPCLKVNERTKSYQAYLSIMTGSQLVQIYEDHGQRLFEQNVRTFLQFKGDVNKGIRNTIELQPEKFFAYNNGITATAQAIEFSKNGNIRKIKGFQIVNGGQTTSAIYAASKRSDLDVSKVEVQVKISVVKDMEVRDEFVSKIAEYANTQNKINSSDFFSNSPFHKEMKAYSTRVFAPPAGGSQRRTHWYYERVRGEYLNSRAYSRKKEEKKRFLLENPKNQIIDKLLLSKAENAWKQKPHIVSKGAQYSFKAFADYISKEFEKNNLSITETYFMNAVARVILFRSTERLITQSSWYDGGFRAQTTAYTIAWLSSYLEKSGYQLNFDTIWKNQSLPAGLVEILSKIARQIYLMLVNPVAGYANVAQYAKTALCWENIRQAEMSLDNWDPSIFINKSGRKNEGFVHMPKNDPENRPQALIAILKQRDWMLIFDYYSEHSSANKLSAMQMNILNRMALGQITAPSEGQAKILYDLYADAMLDGLSLQ